MEEQEIIECRGYFLYRHIRLDTGEPFYVGIGRLRNCKINSIASQYNRAFAKTKRNPIWKNIIAKTDYEVEIMFESCNRDEVISKEIEFIALYGRANQGKGTLCNLTDGGDFFEGYVITEEARKKKSESLKGRVMSPETIAKIQEARKSYIPSEETNRKISEAHKGKKLSPESIKKREETRRKNSEERGFYLPKESAMERGMKLSNQRFPPEEKEKAIDMYNSGLTFNAISVILNKSHNAISTLIQRYLNGERYA